MAQQFIPIIREIAILPKLRRGSFHVLRHNFSVFRQSWMVNFMWIGLEPLIYLYAIGYGVGRLIPEIHGMSYFEYFMPGLFAITAMIVPSYETTHGTYSRAHFDRTFSSLYLAPISGQDLFMGELMWGVLKGMISALILTLALMFVGKISPAKAGLIILFSGLVGWFFAALGLFVTSLVRSSESFILYQAGFIIPVAMLSGAYFPIEYLPDLAGYAMRAAPLLQAINVFRAICSESLGMSVYASMIYLMVLGLVFTNLSISRLSKKLDTFLY